MLRVNAQIITQSITGKVIDKESNAPVVNAIVGVVDLSTPIVTSTDSNGYFKLVKVPVGRHTISISYIGYATITLPNTEINSGKEAVINVALTEMGNTMNEVKVQAKKEKDATQNSMISVSGRTFSIEESNRYAGGFGDLTRMAQSFAGVASADGSTNEIVIRGNSPRGLLWRIEGVEVANPNHFPGGDGSSGGGISILQANMIDNSDFLTAAFPAEYGNASSGVFDVHLRKGNSDRHEGSIQLGVIGLEASVEGPLSKKNHSSYLVKYRYSTVALLQKMGIHLVDNTVVPSYQDLTFHFNFGESKAGTFSLFGIGGYSSAGEKAVHDSASWKNIDDKTDQIERYGTGIAGLKHVIFFHQKQSSITTVVGYNYTLNAYQNDTLQKGYVDYNTYQRNLNYQTFRVSLTFNHKQNFHQQWRSGLVASIPFYTLKERASSGVNSYQQLLDEKGASAYLQGFVQLKYRFNALLECNSGVHALYHLLNNTYSIEPRAGLRWTVAPKHTLSVGLGLHSRLEPVSIYLSKVHNDAGIAGDFNKQLRPTKALHAVLGYDFSFLENMRLKTEVYFQYLFDVPIDARNNSDFSMLNYSGENLDRVLVNKGKGMNYGLEITLEKFFSHNYYFLITGSFFNSKYLANDGVWRNTRYNSNVIANAVGGKEFNFGKKKNMCLGANMKLVTMGGNRTTPIDLNSSAAEGSTVYYSGQAFTKSYPWFFRWDVGVYFKMNRKKYSWKLSADFQNITDRKNVFNSSYDPYISGIKYAYGLGFIPVLNWKIDF